MKTMTKFVYFAFASLAFACFAFPPTAHAVSPPPDGGYPGGNTAEGQNALFSLTTGGFNTAVGFFSLRGNTTNSFNTTIGAAALLANTADQNTAIGAGALLSNTTGGLNTAVGGFALQSNIVGAANTADGAGALKSNTEGNGNTAIGTDALASDDPGGINTAIGENALVNNTTGSGNTAIGAGAGSNQTTGSDNVYIGGGSLGVAGESGTCYIGGIFGESSSAGVAVFINSSGKLGTTTSSKRFKDEIKPMDKASETLFALKPVTFRYKKELDPEGIQQWGLVAEDVQKVNPALVALDKEGRPYSVRYDQVNAMLLNEFLKEHRKTEKLEATVASLIATVKEQAAQIQKVSAQLELSKAEPQTVVNNR
jgi:trimeric autotransporter adhesin